MASFMVFKSSNHQNQLPKRLSKMLNKLELTDCTIYCEDGQIRAHSVILSAGSLYFHSIFMNMEKSGGAWKPAVILKDTKMRDLEYLVKFIYEGSVSVPTYEVPGVLKNANALQVEGFDLHESTIILTSTPSTNEKHTVTSTSNSLPSTSADHPMLNLDEFDSASQLLKLADYVEEALNASINSEVLTISNQILPGDDSETEWCNFTNNSGQFGLDVSPNSSPVFEKLPEPILVPNPKRNIDIIKPPVWRIKPAQKEPNNEFVLKADLSRQPPKQNKPEPSKKTSNTQLNQRFRKRTYGMTLRSSSSDSGSSSESYISISPIHPAKKHSSDDDPLWNHSESNIQPPKNKPVRRNARRLSTIQREPGFSPYVFR